MGEYNKFVKIKEILKRYKEGSVKIKEELLSKLKGINDNQFLFVKYTVDSPPQVQDFSFVKDNNIVKFVRDSLKEQKVSIEDLKE